MASSDEAPAASVPGIDMTRPPLGDRVARALVEAVAAGDDRLEGHALEIKGKLDLKSKEDKAKLAKFILAAANRMPDKAAAAFGGYAVMVIGVVNGQIVGIPPVENLDIENAVTRFIGSDGPGWDLVRVRVSGSANDVLLLVVEPPQPGHPLFACLKDGAGLVEGEIYVRTNGKTSKANAGDIRNLSRRAAATLTPAVAFDVSLGGEVTPVLMDDDATLEAFIAKQTSWLLDALPRPEPEPMPEPASVPPPFGLGGERSSSLMDIAMKAGALSPLQDALARNQDAISKLQQSALTGLGTDSLVKFNKRALFAADMEPESRSEDAYRAEVAAWEERFREAWPEAKELFVGLRLPWASPRVRNLEDVFLQNVQLVIHLDGDVRGVEADTDFDGKVTLRTLDLPRPPRIWGPKKRDYAVRLQTPAFPAMTAASYSPGRSMTWDNTGSVTATFDIGDLRPGETYECSDSDLILVVDDPPHAPVHGTWQITARDHNRIYAGDFTATVRETVDLTGELRVVLSLDGGA